MALPATPGNTGPFCVTRTGSQRYGGKAVLSIPYEDPAGGLLEQGPPPPSLGGHLELNNKSRPRAARSFPTSALSALAACAHLAFISVITPGHLSHYRHQEKPGASKKRKAKTDLVWIKWDLTRASPRRQPRRTGAPWLGAHILSSFTPFLLQ